MEACSRGKGAICAVRAVRSAAQFRQPRPAGWTRSLDFKMPRNAAGKARIHRMICVGKQENEKNANDTLEEIILEQKSTEQGRCFIENTSSKQYERNTDNTPDETILKQNNTEYVEICKEKDREDDENEINVDITLKEVNILEQISTEQAKNHEEKESNEHDKNKTVENTLADTEIRSTEQRITTDNLQDNNLHTNEESDDNKGINNVENSSDSIAPSGSLSDILDFSDGSSDNYIPNSSELSDESIRQKKRRKNTNRNGNKIIIPESSSESDALETEPEQQKKKRKSLKERREDRIDRLLKRNAGLPYITKAGKFVQSRNIGILTPCRAKCKERIPEEVRQYVFNEYWHLGSYDERAKYVERLICLKKKASTKVGSKRKREFANKYKLVHFDTEYNICKSCLLKTLGETNRFLQTVNEKIQIFGRINKCERGRAASYRKISESRLNQVREHIQKFPAYESHYSRAKTSRKYLSSDLSVEKMYKLYQSENDDPVSISVYRTVFKDMNLSFKKPSVDTCNKCNLLQNKLKFSKSAEETEKIQSDLKNHQEQYEASYNEKRRDKKTAKESDDTCVIAFDLQQCLPTPLLTTSSAFYKRQLWVYNLTIHDFKTNHAYCYMWPESSGGRGANQIASCLYDFVTNRLPLLHPNVEYLLMYSDSCAGQNKNSVVTTAMMILMETSSQLTSIEHKFLVPGHTHMEVDSDHSLIERTKKRTSMNIHHPRDWYQLVRTASNRENKFSVIEMTYEDFYDFANFSKKQLQVKKANCRGQKFVWSNVQILKYTKGQFPTFGYKENYEDVDYILMSYARRNKRYDHVLTENVNKCYNEPVPIAAEKKADLISLLEYIDPCVHEFYLNLPTTADKSPNVDPDLNQEDDFYTDDF